jgi:phosphatidylserine/phosphatidylglycerophosphate/cardiolipin synthase-like enzyme
MQAKCIVIGRKPAFVSSANFTEAAQVRSMEFGALIRSEPYAVQLTRHFEALADVGQLRRVVL